MKKAVKAEQSRPKPLPDIHRDSLTEAKSYLSIAKKKIGGQQVSPSAVAYGLIITSPKSGKDNFHLADSPKALTRQRKDSPSKPPGFLPRAKKLLDLVSRQRPDLASPKARLAGLSPHPPAKAPNSKSPLSKIRRSLTPHDRVGLKRV